MLRVVLWAPILDDDVRHVRTGTRPLVYGTPSSSYLVAMFVYATPGAYGLPPSFIFSMKSAPGAMSRQDAHSRPNVCSCNAFSPNCSTGP